LSAVSAEKLKNRIIFQEATAVVCIGATIGKVARITKPTLTNQQINTVVPNAKLLDSKFSYYVLQTLAEHLQRIAGGSATPLLNKSRFELVELCLPPLHEQQKIANVLGAFDDLITLNDSVRNELVTLGDVIVKNLSESDAYPIFPLEGLVSATVSGVWGSDTSAPDSSPMQVVRGIDLAAFRQLKASRPPLRFIPTSQVESRMLQVGDLIIEGSGSNCGRSWVPLASQLNRSPNPMAFSNFCKRFSLNVSDKEIGPRFIQHWLNIAFESGVLSKFRSGTAMPNLDVQSFLRLVNIPVGAEILNSESILARLDEAADKVNEESFELATYRDELLPLLISGKIKVRDLAA
jgi:type I restriction enzyme S subunit